MDAAQLSSLVESWCESAAAVPVELSEVFCARSAPVLRRRNLDSLGGSLMGTSLDFFMAEETDSNGM